MKAFNDYDDVQVNNFEEREKVELGGHICKIYEVKIDSFKSKDGTDYEQLVLKIDLETPDKQAGFYQRRFAEDAKKDALAAKWKGYFKVSIPNDSSIDTVKSLFKTFTTSVEESNPGYKWNWEENTLVGKMVGIVFALREFESQDGRIIAFSEPRFARSTEKVLEAKIPKVRMLDKTYMDYEEYKRKKENGELRTEAEGKAMEENESTIDSDDLPF